MVALAALFAASGMAASADPLEASLSLTVNPLSGRHEVDGGHVDTLSFLPLPLGELTLRSGAESLHVEGLPAITFGFGNAGVGVQSTKLSLLNATYRHAFRGGWYAGVGQTVYNQFTSYEPVSSGFVYQRGGLADPIDGSEAQYSRVTGARFEIGRVMRRGGESLEVTVAVNPRMHGVQFTRIPSYTYICSGGPCYPFFETFTDPENASQVDLAVRAAHRVSKHGELIYGLRYLNYTAHYDVVPGQLADRNVGFAPVIGFRIKL